MTTMYRLTNANPFPVAYDDAGHTVDPYSAVEAELDPTVQHLVDTGVLANTGAVEAPAEPTPDATPADNPAPDISAFMSTPGGKGRKTTNTPTAPTVDNGEDTPA